MSTAQGPLAGLRVVEFAGIGPGPFCGLLLSDLGADVLRIDRADQRPSSPPSRAALAAELLGRGRRSAAIDLKSGAGVALALRLIERSDALIEGFRPGVMERLGLGPEPCLERNPRLIYGRITGWGQDGPLASAAGHDLNYIALAGALQAMGRAGEPPAIPLNLVGDFGGGGFLLALGVLAALFERQRSGRGQVVDAAMVDGAALLMTLFHGLRAAGIWSDARGTNMLDGGAPYYDVYETRDGRHVAIGALEPRFYAELLRRIGLGDADLPAQGDAARWPELRERLRAVFREKTRDEWCDLLEGSDACFAPVLSMGEAPEHPHNRARATFAELAGVSQAAPAPRFGRSRPAIQRPPPYAGQHTDEVLADWGVPVDELRRLRADRVIA
jgi:alpha-methylacyl-CoA racemase